MHPLTRFIAAGMLTVSAFAANAAPAAYGEAFDTLYRIDLAASEATAIGGAGTYFGQTIGNISGLTTTADGSLYAIAGGFKLLVRLDPKTGRANVVGDLGLSGQGDPTHNDALDLNMISACDGTFYLSSAIANKIWTVKPDNGATTLLGLTGHTITGLVARDGVFYGAGGKGDNRFYRIDPKNGAATPIGDFGPALTRWVNSVSMSFGSDGTLWAVINYVPPEHDSDTPPDWSDLATIDPATGKMTILGPLKGPDSLRRVGMKGFTVGPAECRAADAFSAPAGSPWSFGLLGALLALAAMWNERRRLRA